MSTLSETDEHVPYRAVLLNPGPVNVHEQVRAAMSFPDVCHREREPIALIARVRDKVTEICGGDQRHTSVVITGSGTAAMEAAVSSIIPPEGRVLVIDNGHYGDRLHRIVTVHGISEHHLNFGWTNMVDPAVVDEALLADPTITHVAMVHHETSTGMINPVRAVGEVVARHGRSLVVDGISSIGSESFDMVDDHVDWCIGTANKCLEGLPGVSFVCARRDRLDALARVPARSFYLDLHGHYVAQDQSGAPLFTPAAQVLYAFERALDLARLVPLVRAGSPVGLSPVGSGVWWAGKGY